jgi:hypothetical protein
LVDTKAKSSRNTLKYKKTAEKSENRPLLNVVTIQ